MTHRRRYITRRYLRGWAFWLSLLFATGARPPRAIWAFALAVVPVGSGWQA